MPWWASFTTDDIDAFYYYDNSKRSNSVVWTEMPAYLEFASSYEHMLKDALSSYGLWDMISRALWVKECARGLTFYESPKESWDAVLASESTNDK